jgi:hypothetical protein
MFLHTIRPIAMAMCIFACLSNEAVARDETALIGKALDTVVMGVHHFPPDFIVSADGKNCGGAGVELARAILAAAALTLETRCVMPARMYLLMERGEIDLTINIKSTEALANQPAPVFVEPPYMALQLVLYSHKKTSQAPTDDSISAIRAFDYHGQRKRLTAQGHQFVDVADAGKAIEVFLHQRTEHLLTYEGPFRAYLQQHNPGMLDHLERRAIDSIPTYFVVSGKSQHQTKVVNAIEQYARKHHCRFLRSCVSP